MSKTKTKIKNRSIPCQFVTHKRHKRKKFRQIISRWHLKCELKAEGRSSILIFIFFILEEKHENCVKKYVYEAFVPSNLLYFISFSFKKFNFGVCFKITIDKKYSHNNNI